VSNMDGRGINSYEDLGESFFRLSDPEVTDGNLIGSRSLRIIL